MKRIYLSDIKAAIDVCPNASYMITRDNKMELIVYTDRKHPVLFQLDLNILGDSYSQLVGTAKPNDEAKSHKSSRDGSHRDCGSALDCTGHDDSGSSSASHGTLMQETNQSPSIPALTLTTVPVQHQNKPPITQLRKKRNRTRRLNPDAV